MFISSGSSGVLERMDYRSVLHNVQGLILLDEKIDYLIVTGEYFLYQKRFAEARKIAEYVLRDLDENSFHARKILMVAQIKEARYE